MDNVVQARRTAQAHIDIVDAVTRIGGTITGVEEETAAVINAGSQVRDPALKALFESEALAVLLTKIADMVDQAGAESAKATTRKTPAKK